MVGVRVCDGGGCEAGKEGLVPDSSSNKGGRTWAKVVGGHSRRTSHKVSEVEVDQL